MAKPYNLENTIRVHDEAIFNWLSTLRVDYGDIANVSRNNFPILTVFASPERAFAQVPDLLVSRGWIPGATPEERLANVEKYCPVLPLPLATVQRGEPILDRELTNSMGILRNQAFDLQTLQYQSVRWPAHYRMEYRINFWSYKRYTDNHIREWLMSQFGNNGMSEYEVMLPVNHGPVVGTWSQALKMLGSIDLSTLEGDEQRYIRHEVTLSFRFFFFKNYGGPNGDATLNADIITTVGTDGGILEEGISDYFYGAGKFSANYFAIPSNGVAGIPVTGSAAASLDSHSNLVCATSSSDDSVELVQSVLKLEDDGYAIVSISFSYQSDFDAVLEVTQVDPVTRIATSAMAKLLPVSREKRNVHVFALVHKQIFGVYISGVPYGAGTVTLRAVDIRQIRYMPAIAPDEIFSGNPTKYAWNNVPNVPYLVIGKVVSTTGGPNTFSVLNDLLTPSFTTTQEVDSSIDVGVIALTQPLASSIVANVTGTTALDSVVIREYCAPYNGNDP